jgi:hypothetical protein
MALFTTGNKFEKFPVTTLEAFGLVETQGVVRIANVNALMNDGNFLEAVVSVAFISASHRGSVSGSPLRDFALRLVEELLPEPAFLRWNTDQHEPFYSSVMDAIVVPFLSAVNSRWVPIDGLNLGNLQRPSTGQMVDLVVEEHGIYGEVKNHKEALDSQGVLSIVSRLKVDARVLFVITNRLKDGLSGLTDWRSRLQTPSTTEEIDKIVTRLHLSSPKRTPTQKPSLLPVTRSFHDVNLVAIKRRGDVLSLEPLSNSDPVSSCRTLVIVLPIRELAVTSTPLLP